MSDKPNYKAIEESYYSGDREDFFLRCYDFASFIIGKHLETPLSIKLQPSEREELQSSLVLRAVESVESDYFDAEKVKFCSFLYSSMRNGVSSYIYHMTKSIDRYGDEEDPLSFDAVEDYRSGSIPSNVSFSVTSFDSQFEELFPDLSSSSRSDLTKMIQSGVIDEQYVDSLDDLRKGLIKVLLWRVYNEQAK